MKKRYLLAGLSGVVAGAVATKLLTRPRDVSWPRSLDFIYHPEYSWFTDVDGVRIHYQDAGDEKAPPILLIHGFISSSLIWTEVLLPLAEAGFRVIALDLPGYGYSDKPLDFSYTIEAQAQAVVGLMDRLQIQKATIVGASYGGAIAATMALDYADRVARLVLIGAVTNNDAKKKFMMRILQIPILGDIATPLYLGSRWALRKRMEALYQRTGRSLDERMVAARHHLLETANMQRAMIRSGRRWDATRIQREMPLISQPTIIIWGEDDSHIPLSEGRRLRDAIPGARMVVFRNCGHLPPTEYPQQFVNAVSEFCKMSEPAAVISR